MKLELIEQGKLLYEKRQSILNAMESINQAGHRYHKKEFTHLVFCTDRNTGQYSLNYMLPKEIDQQEAMEWLFVKSLEKLQSELDKINNEIEQL
jgi:predicted  nucleic acid-binding Zn-ribbon protein